MKIEDKEHTILGLHSNFEHARVHRSQKRRTRNHVTKNVQQAGAELCQAQIKLG